MKVGDLIIMVPAYAYYPLDLCKVCGVYGNSDSIDVESVENSSCVWTGIRTGYWIKVG